MCDELRREDAKGVVNTRVTNQTKGRQAGSVRGWSRPAGAGFLAGKSKFARPACPDNVSPDTIPRTVSDAK